MFLNCQLSELSDSSRPPPVISWSDVVTRFVEGHALPMGASRLNLTADSFRKTHDEAKPNCIK